MNKKNQLFYYGTSSRIIFVRFLGELKSPKRHFEINWPLVLHSIYYLIFLFLWNIEIFWVSLCLKITQFELRWRLALLHILSLFISSFFRHVCKNVLCCLKKQQSLLLLWCDVLVFSAHYTIRHCHINFPFFFSYLH